MGQDIESSHFSDTDFSQFRRLLEQETDYLGGLFEQCKLSQAGAVGGFEIEAWLVNRQGNAEPVNQVFLEKLASPLVVPELAAFNVELNIDPHVLKADVFSLMEESLSVTWQQCRAVADKLNTDLLMIGILPSIREEELTLANMTQIRRYQALNEQVLKMRNGTPLSLEIAGREKLSTEHFDVMLESAATSFQIHLQMPLDQSVALFNLPSIVSAPMVAVSANSPYLFGRDLWAETRIPLFEQSVECGRLAHERVTMGGEYVERSLFEKFRNNLDRFPILVPYKGQEAIGEMAHLRFHNGTIWRWNRPLIGFDEDGQVHLRVEHRVVPAGPTITDSIANAALFYGMMYGLQMPSANPEQVLPFARARDNFYACAREGLDAEVCWPGYARVHVRQLVLERLLPAAHEGLKKLGITGEDSSRYLGIIEQRVSTGQNGASWQRSWVARHGADMQALTLNYLERQNSGKPVSEWSV